MSFSHLQVVLVVCMYCLQLHLITMYTGYHICRVCFASNQQRTNKNSSDEW